MWVLGEITPSYILHTRAFGTYLLGGLFTQVAKKYIRWWYFTCKKPENIICDGILHVNMFHYFKFPYFTCTFFTKFTYNEYIGPYFLSHVVLWFLPVIPPSVGVIHVYFPFELHPKKPLNTSQIVASFTLSILKITLAINFQEDNIL